MMYIYNTGVLPHFIRTGSVAPRMLQQLRAVADIHVSTNAGNAHAYNNERPDTYAAMARRHEYLSAAP